MYEKREEEHGSLLALYKKWGIQDEATQEMLARRYIERFIGCVENLTNPSCTLSVRQKKQEIHKMLQKPRVRRCLHQARPHSIYMKMQADSDSAADVSSCYTGNASSYPL